MSLRAKIIAICVGAALVPTASSAQTVNAPPGNAGVDEYLETVPQADGNRPSINGPQRPALSDEVVARLREQGSDGVAAARLAELTSPEAAARGGKPSSGAGGAKALPQIGTGSGGGNVAERVARTAVGSEQGMGAALPLILAFAAGLGVAMLVMRRRAAREARTPE